MSNRVEVIESTEEPLIQPVCAVFRRFLKGQGLKFTPERARILDSVLSKPGVFEAEELLFEMRQDGRRVSKATIYRTLKHLLEAKIITEVLIDSKQAHYQLSIGREPKGYLVCVESHRIVEVDAPELNKIRDRICREHGFEPVSHRFVIYGVSTDTHDEGFSGQPTNNPIPGSGRPSATITTNGPNSVRLK